MDRRQLLQLSVIAGLSGAALAATPMPMATLGKSGLRVSRFCLGGYHMRVQGAENAVQMIHRALDLGVNFFDSAHHYNGGASDEAYGAAFTPTQRKQVLLMSKAQRRDKASAMQQLEDTLRRMKTDYLDLWQCHEVSTMAEVDQILGPNGALEAFVQAKQQGKVRHIGFTGHRDPAVHLRLLREFDGWETVQMPINLIDPHYLSFLQNVLPAVRQKGLGVLAMKSNGMGAIGKAKIATITECLRFSSSQNVDTVVSGPETLAQLEENIGVIKTAPRLTPSEISTLLERTKRGPVGASIESYKKPESKAHLHRLHHDGEPA